MKPELVLGARHVVAGFPDDGVGAQLKRAPEHAGMDVEIEVSPTTESGLN